MQKPRSFKAIELLTYVQIGVAFIVSSYGILFLIVREMLPYGHELLNYGYGLWNLLIMSFGWIDKYIASPGFILGKSLSLLFELIVSSLFLFILKTKSLFATRGIAILAMIMRIALHSGLIYLLGLPLFIFLLCSIFVVTFLFREPVQHYMMAILALVLSIALGSDLIAFFNRTLVYGLTFIDVNVYSFIFRYGSILIVLFLFREPVQHYIRLRSQQHNNSVRRN